MKKLYLILAIIVLLSVSVYAGLKVKYPKEELDILKSKNLDVLNISPVYDDGGEYYFFNLNTYRITIPKSRYYFDANNNLVQVNYTTQEIDLLRDDKIQEFIDLELKNTMKNKTIKISGKEVKLT